MLLAEMERRKRFVTSGVLSLYWLLSSFSALILFYSELVKQPVDRGIQESTFSKEWLGLTVVQLVLCFFTENPPISGDKRECQLGQSSFFSRCFYTWITNFMLINLHRPLEPRDFSRLVPEEQSVASVADFEKLWKEEVDKQKQSSHLKTEAKPVHVSVAKVMFKACWWEIVAGNLFRLVALVAELTMPLLLGSLIGLMESSTTPTWKGLVYLAAFFTASMVEFVTINYMLHFSDGTARKVRAALTNAVFNKSLHMKNRARAQSSSGEIVNLLSTDLESVKDWAAYLWVLWVQPVYVVTCFVLMIQILGTGAVAGGAVLLLVTPANAWLAQRGQRSHKQRMDKKDERIKLLTEVFNGIKVLKLYAWELAYGEKIRDMRNEELAILMKQRLFGMIGTFAWCIVPMLMGLASFATYVYVEEDRVLTAEIAFKYLAILGMLSGHFTRLPHIVAHFAKGLNGIKRFDKFLNNDEIDPSSIMSERSENAISMEDATFTWDHKMGAALKNINLAVPKGGLVAVVGRVGTGKSSLLSAILGEIEKDQGKINVDGAVAYVPQEAWIQNDTLRNNILFGKKYNPMTYKAVIDACALGKDLDILPGSDLTEIGEKGINLSGGQKQRVSMARAVYHNADIYLLDDPLSAVDAHVGKHMFEYVIGSKGFLRNKTRILVTNNLTWLSEMDKIFVMDGGEIAESGSLWELLACNGTFGRFLREYRHDQTLNEDGSDVDDPETATGKYESLLMDFGYASDQCKSDEDSQSEPELTKEQIHFKRSISRMLSHEDKQVKDYDDDEKEGTERLGEADLNKKEKGKFVDEEEIEEGEVQMKYILPYLAAVGKLSIFAILLTFAAFKVCEVAQNIWIKEWTSNDDLRNFSLGTGGNNRIRETNEYYIFVYAGIGVIEGISLIIHQTFVTFGVMKAATKLHERMLFNILRGKMAFFSMTPVGRIVNRFSQDMEPLDGAASDHLAWLLHVCCGVVTIFFVIMYTLPKFVVMVIPAVLVNYYMQKCCVPARRQISRLMSKRRSPVFSHFSETLSGTSVIRAFRHQARFSQDSAKKVDAYNELVFHINTVDRWMGIRLDMFNVLCFVVTVMFALSERSAVSGAALGLMMQYALQINNELNGLVRASGEIDKSLVSVEKIGQYSSKETEAPLHTEVKPEKDWPHKGAIEFKDYSLRYRPDTELVLKKLNVSIHKGERIGIVGRTGAGKSTLTLGLFRLIEPTEGSVNIDGHDISKLGLFDLRSNLTILPQEPVLFAGNLKTNLDPMNVHSEEEIYNALDHAHLKDFVTSLPDRLNYECGEGGQNLSVGQRQLICLARSLLRKSRVLVLDEATAAVDMQTDELIQNTIKSQFRGCTILTIAHRLNTILDYDRILVLSYGEVKEFDSPKALLQNKDSMFYSMAKDAKLVL